MVLSAYECELRKSVAITDEANGVKTPESVILAIIESRSIYNWINIDIIENVSQFLKVSEIFSLLFTSKTMIKFFPETWIILHNRSYPQSILPRENHQVLKHQMMLHAWYYKMYSKNEHNDFIKFIAIDENEHYIWMRYLENQTCFDRAKKSINNAEILSYVKENKRLLINAIKIDQDVLDLFKHYDKPDIKYSNDVNYKCISFYKGDFDMRLFGLNPSNIVDYKNWYYTGKKWAKFVYNEYDEEWEQYDGHFNTEHVDWIYGYKEMPAGYTDDPNRDTLLYYELSDHSFKYRCRKKPDWFKFNFY